MAIAARTFDVSEFPTVFANTPDYELSDPQREMIKQILGPRALENAGYLTAMQAYYIAWGKSAARLEEALERARAEHRSVTVEELQEMIKANGGHIPALARQEPIGKPKLVFESIEIRGSKAIVRYDDGAALQEAVLVKMNGRWLIAGIRPIWIHF